MPSADETTYLIEVMPDTALGQDSFTSRDVDVLVSRIKENLRLSGLKSRSNLAHQQHKMRASPYSLPSRCELCSDSSDQQQQQLTSSATGQTKRFKQQQQQQHQHHRCTRRHHQQQHPPTSAFDLDDSYERFQALLRNGALIKEAVKRLQTTPEDIVEDNDEHEDGRATSTTSATSTTLDSMDEEDDELVGRDDFCYRRKRFYYDSEDEPLPPVYQPLDL